MSPNLIGILITILIGNSNAIESIAVRADGRTQQKRVTGANTMEFLISKPAFRVAVLHRQSRPEEEGKGENKSPLIVRRRSDFDCEFPVERTDQLTKG